MLLRARRIEKVKSVGLVDTDRSALRSLCMWALLRGDSMFAIDAAAGAQEMYELAVDPLISLSVMCETSIRPLLVSPLFRERG